MEERGRGECGLERSLLTSLARFCRVLRLWGVRLSAGASHTAIEALREIEVTNREDFRHALRITLVQRPEDFPLFTYLFNAFWATRGAREQLRPNEELGGRPVDAKRLGREVEADEEMAPGDTGVRHLEGAVGTADAELEGLHWSRAAVTGGRPQQDIAHGDPLERSELLRLADRLSTALATRASRRRVRDASGRFADPRGMLRDSLRYGGIPVEFRWKTRRVTRTRLLLFCDVSRSMDECVAFFLRFAAAVLRRLWRVDIFLFATDIVRVTNVWTGQSWDELKLMIPDVGGGTQIGKCLDRFLESYDTSLLGPGTVVMILSDGLEAGDPALLDSAMERLRRRAHAVIWLNPLLHLEGYEPRAAGMAVALKHVDVFAPVHDNASMWELVDTIRGVAKRRRGGFMASVIRERERISKVPSHHGAATLKHGGVPAEESSGIVRDEEGMKAHQKKGDGMKTAQLRRSWVPRCLAFFGLLLLPHTARAYQVTPDLEIRFVYRGEDYVRLTNTERRLFDPKTGGFFFEQNDHLMAQRNELRIDAEYTLHSERLFPWLGQLRFFGQLRPWWDSDWRISNTGQGKRDDELTPFWEHPFTRSGAPEAPGSLSNSVDPLFREYYVDIAPNNFFFRIGRQIIPWGKSDGVYMLDVINPFNLRNPTIFEEENIKIPIWAANLNWRPFPDSNLQLIYDPHYFNHVWPGLRTQNHLPIEGRFHDWTYQIVGFFNDFYNGEFGFKVPVFTKLPANTWSNSIIGFRWSDTKWRVNYTLNYLYTYTPSLIDFPNTGTFLTGTMVLRQPARIHVAGGSADYDVKSPNPWLDGTVFRVETAFTLGDQYYKGLVGNPVDTDHWGVMAGVDRYVLGDYLDRPVFASMQYWHDLVISTPASCGGCGPRAGSFQDLGFNGGFQGLRGPYKSLMTLYLYKTWLAGDTLIGEFFALYEHQFQDWWIRPKMTYKYDDYTTVALGWNVFAGGKQTPYGEWKDNTNAFVEIRRTIF